MCLIGLYFYRRRERQKFKQVCAVGNELLCTVNFLDYFDS